MPTGYTADVAEGKVTDFRTFALRCARAFGATVTQRDDPMEEPPKHREVSSYYRESVERDEARVNQLAGFTTEDAECELAAEYTASLERYHESVRKDTETRNRYNAMLAEVMAWTPPTPDHDELKKFMIEQLTESRRFDVYPPKPPVLRSPELWLAEQRQRARESLARSRKYLAEEVERCDNANRWIDALYESLNAVGSPASDERSGQ